MDFFSIAKEQFLKNYNLKNFPQENSYIQVAEEYSTQAMNYLHGKPFLDFVYFGERLFASVDERLMEYISKYIEQCGEELFRVFNAPNIMNLNRKLEEYGYTIAHLAQYFLPSSNPTKKIKTKYHIKVYKKEEIKDLYGHGFSMALCESTIGERRDVLATACILDGEIVGVAGCTNDSETMWQIGVDVKEAFRKKGIATALVLKLKEEIIKLKKCPFYCCAWSNLASKHLAKSTGFVDGWVELTAKPISEDWIQRLRIDLKFC